MLSGLALALGVELMPWRKLSWTQRIFLVVLAVLAAIALRPWLGEELAQGLGIALVAVYLLAYLFAIVFLPLIVFVLLRFAYSLFARPYVRLWRIKRFRNARLLKETIRRGGRDG
ncbi:MAG: hypothetical protein WA738_10435 [Candidatus Angelobacter sp.]